MFWKSKRKKSPCAHPPPDFFKLTCGVARGILPPMKKPFLAIASFLLMSSAARAENYARDFFSVSGVPAAASSSSSSEAKKRALDGAREKAFFSVIKRLLKSSDVEGVVAPDSYNMDKFIEKYRISNEKMTPSSYSATVDVQIGRALM
jgi:hypothetical protein